MTDDRTPNLDQVYETLKEGFADRFSAVGGHFEAGVSYIRVRAEVTFDGSKGPAWSSQVLYAEARTPEGLGPYRSIRPVEEAVQMLRQEVEDFLGHLRQVEYWERWDRRDLQIEDRERLIREVAEARDSGDATRAEILAAGLRKFGVSVDEPGSGEG